MYTEDDLRATFGTLEQEAPTIGETLAGVETLRQRRTTRRRVTGVTAAVVVTAALTAGSLAAPGLLRDNNPEQVQPANPVAVKPLEFPFAVEDTPGFKTFYQGASHPTLVDNAKVFQTNGEFPRDTNQQPYDLFVFEAGKYNPAAARAGEPIDVRGKPGFYRPDMPCHCSGESPISGLAWEYAPNTWALVQYFKTDVPVAEVKENLVRIATAVRFDKTTPLRVPFKVGYLPEGLQLTMGDMFTWDPDRAGAHLGLAPTDPDKPRLSIGMFLFPGDRSDLPVGEPSVQDAPLGDGKMVLVNVGPFVVQLESYRGQSLAPAKPVTPSTEREKPTPGLPVEDLVKIARSITAAGAPLDRSTWIDAAAAIPAR